MTPFWICVGLLVIVVALISVLPGRRKARPQHDAAIWGLHGETGAPDGPRGRSGHADKSDPDHANGDDGNGGGDGGGGGGD